MGEFLETDKKEFDASCSLHEAAIYWGGIPAGGQQHGVDFQDFVGLGAGFWQAETWVPVLVLTPETDKAKDSCLKPAVIYYKDCMRFQGGTSSTGMVSGFHLTSGGVKSAFKVPVTSIIPVNLKAQGMLWMWTCMVHGEDPDGENMSWGAAGELVEEWYKSILPQDHTVKPSSEEPNIKKGVIESLLHLQCAYANGLKPYRESVDGTETLNQTALSEYWKESPVVSKSGRNVPILQCPAPCVLTKDGFGTTNDVTCWILKYLSGKLQKGQVDEEFTLPETPAGAVLIKYLTSVFSLDSFSVKRETHPLPQPIYTAVLNALSYLDSSVVLDSKNFTSGFAGEGGGGGGEGGSGGGKRSWRMHEILAHGADLNQKRGSFVGIGAERYESPGLRKHFGALMRYTGTCKEHCFTVRTKFVCRCACTLSHARAFKRSLVLRFLLYIFFLFCKCF